MALTAGGSFVRRHPFLATYLGALAAVWLVTGLTWQASVDGALRLDPIAQALQYLLVLAAATLASLRLRILARDDGAGAVFGFYERRWAIADDVGGRTFWTALWIGAAAMVVNVLLFVVADLATGGPAAIPTYVAWVGSGIAAGGVIGMFGAVLALVAATLTSSLRRRRA